MPLHAITAFSSKLPFQNKTKTKKQDLHAKGIRTLCCTKALAEVEHIYKNQD